MDSKTYKDRLEERLQEIFDNCDGECENANYHGFTGLASNIFDSIKWALPTHCQEDVAKEISKAITDKI